MADLTFRDFAGAVMGQDMARAAEVLEALLGVDAKTGQAAAAHFQTSMAADPSFAMKAMGLRAAVTSGTDDAIAGLLVDCFGLDAGAIPTSISTLRKKYPAP